MNKKEKTKPEFDLSRVYSNILTKKELIKCISATYENEFQVIFLPTSKNSADILIRDVKSKMNRIKNNKELSNLTKLEGKKQT